MRYAMLSRTSEATSAPKAVASSEATSKSLRIGEANDSFEQEADRVADEVMAGGAQLGWSFSKIGIGAPIQVKCSCGGSSTPEGECEECKETGMLQREASGPTRPGVAPPIVHEVLRAPGQPLDAQVVSFFEPRFSLDFSKVRVHTDHQAAQAAKAVGALAYTVGNHIVFGDGDRSQSTTSGRRLLAHELAHVVQQENHSLLQRKEDPVRRFVEGQLVVAQTPFPLMDKLGGARGQQKVKQIAKGDCSASKETLLEVVGSPIK